MTTGGGLSYELGKIKEMKRGAKGGIPLNPPRWGSKGIVEIILVVQFPSNPPQSPPIPAGNLKPNEAEFVG